MEDLTPVRSRNASYFIEHFGDAEHLNLEIQTDGQAAVLKPIGSLKCDDEQPERLQAFDTPSYEAKVDGEIAADRSNPSKTTKSRKLVSRFFGTQARENLPRKSQQHQHQPQQSFMSSSKTQSTLDDPTNTAEPSTQRSSGQDMPREMVPGALEPNLSSMDCDSIGRTPDFTFPSGNRAQSTATSLRPIVTPREYTIWDPDREDNWFAEPPNEPIIIAQRLPYDFLDLTHKGTATLTYNDATGSLIAIHNLDVSIIQSRSALLAAAFEAADPKQQLHLDIISSRSVEPFLRYLYTGEYNAAEDVSVSLLVHSELYFVASVFDLAGLKSQALVNTIYTTQYACSSPDKPVDLFAAIRFCYDHHQVNAKLVEHILAYIIAQFHMHRFEYDPDFLALHYEHRDFQIDLAKANNARAAEGEAVDAIIRLSVSDEPFEKYQSYEDPNNRRLQDVVHFFHATDTFEEDRPSKRAGKRVKVVNHQGKVEEQTTIGNKSPLWQARTAAPSVSALTLALRGKTADEPSGFQSDTSSSEDEEYHIVRAASASGASTPTRESGFVFVRSEQISDAESATGLPVRRRRVADRDDDTDVESLSSDSDWSVLT